MKHLFLLTLALALLLTGCKPKVQHTFTHEVLLPITPVKNQGKTETCWAYAMLATIETEHLLRGDSVNLSAVYIARMLKDYQTTYFKSQTSKPLGERAMCQTALNLLQRYGVVGYDVLPDDATQELRSPKNVYLLGAKYTPLEFAHSVCAPEEYIALTSIPDSPYYKRIDIPIPDNWEHNRLMNLPKDTLRKHVNSALRNRHPVCWESKGHAMAIIGMARDENKRAYYVMKNSWGTDQPHGGLVYMPARKVWRDVAAVYMTKEAYSTKE